MFLGHFWVFFFNFWKCFWNENGWLWGVLFSEIYSFESSLYDFWNFWTLFKIFEPLFELLELLWVIWLRCLMEIVSRTFLGFWGNFWVFEIFKNVFGSGLIRWFQRHLKILNLIIFGCLAAVLANVHVFFALLCAKKQMLCFSTQPNKFMKNVLPYFFQMAISQPPDELRIKFFFSWKAGFKTFHMNNSKIWTCHWNSSINDDKVQREGLAIGYFCVYTSCWGTYTFLIF